MALTVAELETLFTADISRFERGAQQVETRQRKLDRAKVTVQVVADASRAETQLAGVEAAARALPDAEIEVDADTSAAEQKLDSLADGAETSGGGAAKGFGAGLLAGLAAIPVAGLLVGIGQAAAAAFTRGFELEASQDRLQAALALDEQQAATLARAAGEAYAQNWGASIEANMDTARRALEAGLIDADETARSSQRVIESLSGVADILGEDIPRVVRSTATLLRTGLAGSADEALDIIVRGQQAGLNVSEDWLDTLDEYATQWRQLGLDGGQALTLLSQAVRGGARDTDTAADALKEFAIRAVDGSTLTAEGFAAIGLSAEEMTATISRGGPAAADALGLTLDKLREVEDPALRSSAAIALFGTKAEDLGEALFDMDLTATGTEFENLSGTASSALSTLTGNTANSVDTMKRSVEVAFAAAQQAMADAFGPQLQELTENVSGNREAIVRFMFDIATAAVDMGAAIVDTTAAGIEGFGQLVGMLAGLNGALADITYAAAVTAFATGNVLLGNSLRDASTALRESGGELAAFEAGSARAADTLRDTLGVSLQETRAKLEELRVPAEQQAAFNDASVALADSIDTVGASATGTALRIDASTGALNTNTAAGKVLDRQIRAVVEGMGRQAAAASRAGASTEDLARDAQSARDALIRQLTAMGLTEAQAEGLADAYGAVPTSISTRFTADTAGAQAGVDRFIRNNSGRVIAVRVSATTVRVPGGGGSIPLAAGGVLTPMAEGGLTPMSSVASMVPANSWRVVGDRMDVSEAYIPLDGSARSLAILAETLRRMPGLDRMADGGMTRSATAVRPAGGDTYVIERLELPAGDVAPEVAEFFRTIRRRAMQRGI
ncbi:MAG: phage tail tape measure protein [Kineosporiaceae bacterium]